MIPVHIAISVDAPTGPRKVNAMSTLKSSICLRLTPVAVQVVLLESLIETNEGSASLSYHLTGNIDVCGLSARAA